MAFGAFYTQSQRVVNCAAIIRHADSGKIRRTSGNNFRAHLVHNVRQRYIHWSFGFHREIVRRRQKICRELESIPDDACATI